MFRCRHHLWRSLAVTPWWCFPAVGNGFINVKFPRGGIFYAQNGAVMGTCQFATQRVTNWEDDIKLPEIFEIR